MFEDLFTFRVAGVTFNNDNGTSRQRIISGLYQYDSLFLEPFTYEGKPAFHVVDCSGQCVGNVPAKLVDDFVSYRDKGYYIDLTVSEILGRDEDGRRIPGYSLGLEVEVVVSEKWPEPTVPAPEPDPVLAPVAPAQKQKKRTGRVMIGFGVFFIVGSLPYLNFVCAAFGAVLLFFGVRRHKRFKAEKNASVKNQ